MPGQTSENNNSSGMLGELRQAKDEARAVARGETVESAEELPQGTSTVEEGEETTVLEASASEETSAPAEGEESVVEEDDGPVRIGGQTFKSSAEALKYAEQLERDKLVTDAHSAGVREALEATRKPVEPTPEPEDDFEQRFYGNPKGMLQELEERAVQKALGKIEQTQQREKLWSDFISENPDIRRKDAERILAENWETIGKVQDFDKARRLLAQRVREEYDEIRSIGKPRTELTAKKQTLSPGGGRPGGVTQKKNDDAPLSLVQQMRKLRELP